MSELTYISGSVSMRSCVSCFKNFVIYGEDDIVDAHIVKEQSGYETGYKIIGTDTFLCEWLPKYSYGVVGVVNCPHCGKPNTKCKWLLSTEKEAKKFRKSLLKQGKK